jgi:hypothetical protein
LIQMLNDQRRLPIELHAGQVEKKK